MRIGATVVALFVAILLALPPVQAESIPPGELFIAERALNVIKAYSSTGQLIDNALVGQLAFPQGLAVSGNDLYVTNAYYGTIGKYTRSGTPIDTALISGLNDPAGMAIDGNDLFVANRDTGLVGKYSTSGDVINAAFISGLDKPTGLAVSGDRLYVTSPSSNKVGVYDANTGAPINASFVPSINTPQSIVVTGDRLFVAFYGGLGGVAEYNAITGEAIPGSFVIRIPQAYGLSLLGDYLYVGSRVNGTVHWYDIHTRALQGSIVGLDNPYGIAVAPAVPEPSTCTLAALGLAALLLTRWHRSGHIIARSAVRAAVLGLLSLFAATAPAFAVTIPTVPVGNAGNAPDSQTGYGSVAYDYRIGTTEVTNGQYAAFLNAKAASDPFGLYSENMGQFTEGGITRSGSVGSYTYATKPNMADKPVNFVSWYDAIRFANWLNNGQGDGDTETGAYTVLGGTYNPSNGLSITRNPDATWFLPSENEWYKAAYYQPSSQGGDIDGYWLYATGSNSLPTPAIANSVGDISNAGVNIANYYFTGGWNGLRGNVKTVGGAGALSESYYGTADQGGNVWEWNEALSFGQFRTIRGGSFLSVPDDMTSSARRIDLPVDDFSPSIGFRVATIPEPSTYALGALGLVALLFSRRLKRS